MKNFYLFAIIIFGFGCQFNDFQFQEIQDFTFSIEQTEDTILTLNWSKVEHSDFEHYVVVRSTEEIPFLDNPSNIFVLAEIDDLNTTSLIDVITKISPDYYYKVFAKIGERYIQTENQHIHFDNPTPFTVRYSISGNTAIYRWEVFKATTFKRYLLAYSSEPLNSDNFLLKSFQIEEKTNRNLTELFNSKSDTLPFFHYYTLIIDMGDRLLVSESQSSTDDNIISFPLDYIYAFHNPVAKHIYLKSNDIMTVFDYQTEQIVNIVGMPFNSRINAQTYNGQDEVLYLNNSTSDFQIFPALSTPQNINTVPIQNFGYTILGHKDWIVTHENNNSGGLTFYDRQSGQQIKKHAIPNNFINPRSFTRLSPTTNEFVIFLPQYTRYYELNDSLNILSENVITHFSTALYNTTVSPDGQYFIGSADGNFYDKQLQVPFSINQYGIFTAYGFSEDGSKFYATTTDNLYYFTFPSLQLEKTESLNFKVNYIVHDNNQLILVGKDNNQEFMVIEFLDL